VERSGRAFFVGGVMGSATPHATALASALFGLPAQDLRSRHGLDAAGIARKTEVVRRALQLHAAHCRDPIQALRCLGGFEIVALAGSYLACAQHGLPVLVDGFVASAAALAAA
jgi:nicotinate-nucleotide--dimethylbenzimidazole phosphoribosyltransferase